MATKERIQICDEKEENYGSTVQTGNGNIQDYQECPETAPTSVMSQLWATPRKNKVILAVLALSNFVAFMAFSIMGSIFPEVVRPIYLTYLIFHWVFSFLYHAY